MKFYYLFLCVFLVACAAENIQSGALSDAEPRLKYPYESSNQCSGCHVEQYRQYEESMHAKAFSNPLFNAQYFNDVVPRALLNPATIPEARKCVACHAPTVFMNYTGLVATPEQASRFETGITCDFCHTLEGYADNGDFKQVSSGKKQGPYQEIGEVTHHSEFSGFMQLSQYCGNCHNATNHIGFSVKSTFDEWRESSYGMSGNASNITCQECHMSKEGFLRKGVAEFDAGQAAHINIGSTTKKQQERDKLYNHSFPGAHSKSQQQGALVLEFETEDLIADAAGQFQFSVLVNNERTGHKMPSGSTGIRYMWLEVSATTSERTKIPVFLNTSTSGTTSDYATVGATPEDAVILKNDVPAGVRIYRSVFVDATGRQTLTQYDAVDLAFDNRLGATEVRSEDYHLQLPAHFSGTILLEANLYYMGAPSSFTQRMQVTDFSPVLVSSQKKQLKIEAPYARGK